jgi:GT2 family glycosyltransferase
VIRVAIALVNYNGYESTRGAIESLLPHLDANDTVLVVDNASTDGSAHQLAERYPTVEVIALSENLGYAHGCNAAIDFAVRKEARYVLLANNDIVFAQDTIDRLVRTADTDPNIGLVVPRIYYYDRPQRIWAAGSTVSRLTGLTQQRGMGRDESEFPPEAVPVDLEMGTGCCMLVRTAIVGTVGRMRDEFFLYYDETDWCWRIRAAGFRIVLDDRAHIWHKVSETVGVSSPTFWYYLTRGHILFVHYNFGGLRRAVALVYFTFIMLPHRLLLVLLDRQSAQSIAMLRGCLNGYQAMITD